MPSARFSSALSFGLRLEGRNLDRTADTGQATNKGVTQNVYSAWPKQQSLAAASVQCPSAEKVASIYEVNYWKTAHCKELPPPPLDQVQFDTFVNTGVERAVRFFKEAVNAPSDKDFSEATLDERLPCSAGKPHDFWMPRRAHRLAARLSRPLRGSLHFASCSNGRPFADSLMSCYGQSSTITKIDALYAQALIECVLLIPGISLLEAARRALSKSHPEYNEDRGLIARARKQRFFGIAHSAVKLRKQSLSHTRLCSSGSPVFEENGWKVIALHHAGGTNRPRLGKRPGVHEAADGLTLSTLARAIAATKVMADT
jgi:hypothetical protein